MEVTERNREVIVKFPPLNMKPLVPSTGGTYNYTLLTKNTHSALCWRSQALDKDWQAILSKCFNEHIVYMQQVAEISVRVPYLFEPYVSLQVPSVLLPHGPGVLLCRPAASPAGAVRNEGSDQDVEGARRGHPGTQQIQGQSAGDDCYWVG